MQFPSEVRNYREKRKRGDTYLSILLLIREIYKGSYEEQEQEPEEPE